MRKEDFVDALSASIPEVEVPIPGVQTPPGKVSFTSLRRLVEKVEESVQSRVDDLQEWVRSQIPEPINKKKRFLTQKFKQLKKKVGQAFKKILPKERKSFLKGYYKNYSIKARDGVDAKTFLDDIEPRVLNFFAEKKTSIKTDQILRIRSTETKLATGKAEFAIKDFLTGIMEIHAGNFSSED